MAVEFNHTIVSARNREASAQFLAEILGLPAPVEFGPFLIVQTANAVSIDFMQADDVFELQHYAFLVSEEEFDQIFERIRVRDLTHWADPEQLYEGEINRRDGGRGVYFEDPEGHKLEVLTRPYGSGGWPGD